MFINYILLNFVKNEVIFTSYVTEMNQSEIDFFDRMAPTWDENEIKSTPIRIRSILSKLPIQKGMDILDLGTGTGVLIPYLSELIGQEGHITAIDLSEGMLSIARKKYGNLQNVSFMRIDFEEEIIPGTYDMAILYCVYPHLHRPKDTFEWLFKMNMKPEGVIVIAFPSDENFINNIHSEKKAEHDHLPPAGILAKKIAEWGYETEVAGADTNEYIVIVKQG